MGLLTHIGGAKVGWNYWSTRGEAETDAVKQRDEAARKAARGYDFGYLTPGSIDELVLPRDLRAYGAEDGEDDERYPVVARAGETVYKVVTP
jgi:hypothetical protein